MHHTNKDEKNIVLLAVENRQPHVYQFLLKRNVLKGSVFKEVDKNGNSALDLAAKLGDHKPWLIPGAALQMQWEFKWYELGLAVAPCHGRPWASGQGHGQGLSWHAYGWLADMPSMGVAGAPCLVRVDGALSLRACALMPWHGCGALAARAVGVSRVPMGTNAASSWHLSSQACLSQPMSSLRTLSTPEDVFTDTHKNLFKDGGDWLSKTSESCSVVAALIATVAFATFATVPVGVRQDVGTPILEKHPAFDVFAIASLIALCSSVTAFVMFLSILTSQHQEKDFGKALPTRLLIGLTSLFVSIGSILVSFCAGHFFVVKDRLKYVAFPVYALACLPVTFFAAVQFPLYIDLM
ncbi:hypothetical protein CJ030_MR1G014934 [Morella rubra]|uniref:PGG domain-containing protein n=1 Tax=Morella rubra TaxID=262757 RepID=A0A6A1WPE8_9ROSI|nr:hypothetical protein CJ030_MR1G014934 [Morella rubra]